MIEDTLDIATSDRAMGTFVCRPERDGPFPERWCYDKSSAERHWERLFALDKRKLG